MENGLRTYERGKCFEGYTLFCHTVNSQEGYERPEGRIHLVDMEGRLVHEWTTRTAQQSFCRLLPNGNLLYPTRDRTNIQEAGLRELAPDSKLLWHYHCRIDHDYQVLDDGRLLIHTIRDFMWPPLGPGLKRQPYMLEVDRAGNLFWEWHGEEHLAELEELLPPEAWRHFQERVRGQFAFDWAHNNTCQLVPPNATDEKESAARGPRRFRPGNIVFSYRSVDIIGVIERPSGRIVWAWGPGQLDGQHKPHMLPNGNILIFDNGTLRGYSRVIELNPLTETSEWEYTAAPRKEFFSAYISGAQRLPNGNTLICEGGKGRLFEVTPEKEIVWDFTSPYHAHTPFMKQNIYRALRYAPEYVKPLLAG